MNAVVDINAAAEMNVVEYVRELCRKPRKFIPKPRYSPDGDFLSIVFHDEDYIAEAVDDVLTIYFSMDSSDIIGFKIKEASTINARHEYKFTTTECGYGTYDEVKCVLELIFGSHDPKFNRKPPTKKHFYHRCMELVEEAEHHATDSTALSA